MFAYCITDMLKKETTKKKYNNMCGDELANLKICSFWVIGCFLDVWLANNFVESNFLVFYQT